MQSQNSDNEISAYSLRDSDGVAKQPSKDKVNQFILSPNINTGEFLNYIVFCFIHFLD